MEVLLIIDMQNAWLNGETPRHDKAAVLQRINRAATCLRQRGGKVIFIQHVDKEAPINSNAWQVDPSLRREQGDLFINKTACDAFADTDLLSQLKQLNAKTLYLCGLATEFCVDTTLRAALSLGFEVIALSDAHTTGNRPHLSAEKVIEHHNWVWAHIATIADSSIRVVAVDSEFI